MTGNETALRYPLVIFTIPLLPYWPLNSLCFHSPSFSIHLTLSIHPFHVHVHLDPSWPWQDWTETPIVWQSITPPLCSRQSWGIWRDLRHCTSRPNNTSKHTSLWIPPLGRITTRYQETLDHWPVIECCYSQSLFLRINNTSHHITSYHHNTLYYVTYLTIPILAHLINTHLITSPNISSHQHTSHLITSHHITSLRSHLLSSYPSDLISSTGHHRAHSPVGSRSSWWQAMTPAKRRKRCVWALGLDVRCTDSFPQCVAMLWGDYAVDFIGENATVLGERILRVPW